MSDDYEEICEKLRNVAERTFHDLVGDGAPQMVTDVVMIVGVGVLLWACLDKGGGFGQIVTDLEAKGLLDEIPRSLEELPREHQQLLFGQTAVAIRESFSQHVAEAGAQPHRRGLRHPELPGQAIRNDEPDAANVAGQPVGILADLLHRLRTVGAVDANGPSGPDTV